jgi:hypothetical protein
MVSLTTGHFFDLMNTANMLRLVALAAIWGGSFLFMRIAAPQTRTAGKAGQS